MTLFWAMEITTMPMSSPQCRLLLGANAVLDPWLIILACDKQDERHQALWCVLAQLAVDGRTLKGPSLSPEMSLTFTSCNSEWRILQGIDWLGMCWDVFSLVLYMAQGTHHQTGMGKMNAMDLFGSMFKSHTMLLL